MMRLFHEEEDLATAWDDTSFGIRIKNDESNTGSKVLGEILEAFQRSDGMIYIGPMGPTASSGLVVAIRSRLPEMVLEQMKAGDESRLNLIDAVAQVESETNLVAKLKAAGREYHGLMPAWAEKYRPHVQAESKYPVLFHLNPQNQQQNNSGWFTVEQLLAWAEGNGPVIKAKAA